MTKLLRDNFAELVRRIREDAGSRQGRSRRRYRLQRRHADLEFPEGRPPRARHRADRRRRRSPTSAASRPSSAISARRWRARSSASTAPAKVVTAANCFAHIEDVHAIVEGIVEMLRARRRVHLGIALSHRPARDAAIRHDLSRAPALLFGRQPQAPCSKCTASKCSTRGRSRAMAARSASMRRARARARCRPSVQRDARRRAARRRDARRLATFRDDVMLSKLRLHALCATSRKRAAASSASARRRAPARWSTTSGSTRPSSTMSARSRAR